MRGERGRGIERENDDSSGSAGREYYCVEDERERGEEGG